MWDFTSFSPSENADNPILIPLISAGNFPATFLGSRSDTCLFLIQMKLKIE